MSKWWNKATHIPLTDSNFQAILDFYLFRCPCEVESGSKKKGTNKYTKVSKRGNTLRSQGWTGSHLNTLIASMKRTSSGKLLYKVVSAAMDVGEEANKDQKTSSLSDQHFEMIVMTERSDMNKTGAIFYYIRNAFAHGSFSVVKTEGKTTYYIESSKDDVVKAQIRLREETLLKWIKDYSLSPATLREVIKEERRQKARKKKEKAA